MKYTKEHLEKLATGDLVYPQPLDVYNGMVRETLSDIMDDPARASEVEEYILMGDLMPFDYASDLCAIIGELAELLLDEREAYKNLLKDAKRDFEDVIRKIDRIAKRI
jgi:hypothetical protein